MGRRWHLRKRSAAWLVAAAEKDLGRRDYPAAIADLKKALARGKADTATLDLLKKASGLRDCVDVLRKRAADFRGRGERLRAAALYEVLLKLAPFLPGPRSDFRRLRAENERIAARLEAADAAYRGRDYDGAVAKANAVLGLDPDNAEAVFLIQEAERMKALAAILRGKAREYVRQGRLDPAARTYEELLRLCPHSADDAAELEAVNEAIRRANALRYAARPPITLSAPGRREGQETAASCPGSALSAGVKRPRIGKSHLCAAGALAAVLGAMLLEPAIIFSSVSAALALTFLLLLSPVAFWLRGAISK